MHKTPTTASTESEYGEPSAQDLDEMLAMGESNPWDNNDKYNDAMVLLTLAAEQEANENDAMMALEDPTTPARPSPGADAIDRALNSKTTYP